ncbi:MAG: hypothetical protein ALECFALPRED_009403 [Alectoria fallacina]|uniref:Uncharacterized protein n=1 Tax=Alectoria fallacina TaxID=1903189 RepID=A0A8H3ID67_9LECA|nr:MAG: hypothetical protein ALECFALPRED_009403 [Alectoria fallacina]
MVISDYMAASRRSPLMRDQWRAGDDHRDSNRRRSRGTGDRRQISPAAPRETDVGLKIKGRAAADSAPESPSEIKKSEREDPVVRRQDEGQETRTWSNVLENLVGTDIWTDHDIEKKEVNLIDGEEHEVDHRNVKYLVSGRNGEGLAARFTPVELTPSVQEVGVANELSRRHAQLEVTIIRRLIPN